MKITSVKDCNTLIEQKKREAVIDAVASGVCALGIVATEIFKNSGREFSDGFLFFTNWALEPGLGLGTIACGFEMAKNMVEKANLNRLREKLINREESRGAR